MQLTSVIQLQWTRKWNELSAQGADSVDAEFLSLLASAKNVSVSLFDSEPWHPDVARFMVCRYESLDQYRAFWRRLKRNSMLTAGYMAVVDVALGAEREMALGEQAPVDSYCALIKLALTEKWFELCAQEKRALRSELSKIIAKWSESLNFNWYDSEAWTGRYSDFVLVKFDKLPEYNAFWNQVRGHPYFAACYVRFAGTVIGAHEEVPLTSIPTASALRQIR